MESQFPSGVPVIRAQSQRLLAEVQQFLKAVEPMAKGLKVERSRRDSSDLQIACDRAHLLWSSLAPLAED